MKSVGLWKSGTLDHFGPHVNKQQQKPLSIRTSLGISLSLKLLHLSMSYKMYSFSLPLCQFVLQEVDITLPENSTWYERYKFDIPVFHLNGKFLMMHRVNIPKLEKQLRKLEQQGTGGWWEPTRVSTLAVQQASSWGNGHGLGLLLSLSRSPNDGRSELSGATKCWHSSSEWWQFQCGNYLPFDIL